VLTRIFGTLVLALALISGSIGAANAGSDNGKGNGGMNNGKGNGHDSAPELNPTAFGSGILLLAGGVLLLNERRRQSKKSAA
jgi:hypothetical protein